MWHYWTQSIDIDCLCNAWWHSVIDIEYHEVNINLSTLHRLLLTQFTDKSRSPKPRHCSGCFHHISQSTVQWWIRFDSLVDRHASALIEYLLSNNSHWKWVCYTAKWRSFYIIIYSFQIDVCILRISIFI